MVGARIAGSICFNAASMSFRTSIATITGCLISNGFGGLAITGRPIIVITTMAMGTSNSRPSAVIFVGSGRSFRSPNGFGVTSVTGLGISRPSGRSVGWSIVKRLGGLLAPLMRLRLGPPI